VDLVAAAEDEDRAGDGVLLDGPGAFKPVALEELEEGAELEFEFGWGLEAKELPV
jgi:hypothetical protein